MAFTIIAVGTSMAGFLTVNTAIAHWFVRKRTRAMSFTSIGSACGAILVPVIAWSIITFGWRETVVASGILATVAGLPVSMVFRRSPEEMGCIRTATPPSR